MADLPDFLTVEEAAVLLRIGRTSAYGLAREWRETGGRKGLPVVELGRQLRVPRAALEGLYLTVLDEPEGEEPSRSAKSDLLDRGPRPRRSWDS